MQLCISTGNQESDITLSIYNKVDGDAARTVWFGQYAILPVTARQGQAAQYFAHHRLTKKKLRDLFFIVDEFNEALPSPPTSGRAWPRVTSR